MKDKIVTPEVARLAKEKGFDVFFFSNGFRR
jgi:hypothetical protein